MRSALRDIARIKERLAPGHALFLDFDLTLSPLARDPHRAYLPKAAKALLERIAGAVPVVIVTGRGLDDIKKRVGLRNVSYIGNHGLEHYLGGARGSSPVPARVRAALASARRRTERACSPYPRVVFEDKSPSFAVGYRLVAKGKAASLEAALRDLKKEIDRSDLLEARLDKKTFEVRPSLKIDKGTACRRALRLIEAERGRRLVPVYIGDSETDEDAFKALRKRGVTVRVGRSSDSAAEWHVRGRREVIALLKRLPPFGV